MKPKVDEILIKDFQRQDLYPGSERNGSKNYSKALKQCSENPLIMAKSGCHSVIQYTYSCISILACFKTLLPKANKIYLQITLAIAVISALFTLMRFQKHAFSMPPKTLPSILVRTLVLIRFRLSTLRPRPH